MSLEYQALMNFRKHLQKIKKIQFISPHKE